jgi:hypothetical protein
MLSHALRVNRGVVELAAKWLGVGRQTFYRRCRRLSVPLQPTRPARRHVFWEAVELCGVVVNKRRPIKQLSADDRERLLQLCKSGWRRRLMLVHPDHGGDAVACERLNQAWFLVRARLGQ